MIHALKIEPIYFKEIAEGIKSFEVRKNDRPYRKGDYVALNEWENECYTGRCTLHKIVYILSDPEYCKEGYIIFGLEPCMIKTRGEKFESIDGERGVSIYERK
jgi:hypothetical protein